MTSTTVPHQQASGPCTDPGMLRAAFPDWSIFRSGKAWLAVRQDGTERHEGPGRLLKHHLSAESVADLGNQLCLQDWLDRLTVEELARVHASGALSGSFLRPSAPPAAPLGLLARVREALLQM